MSFANREASHNGGLLNRESHPPGAAGRFATTYRPHWSSSTVSSSAVVQ